MVDDKTTGWDRFADWANQVAANPRRRLRVGLALIVVGLAVLGVFHDRIYNGLGGPFTLDARALVKLDGVPFQRFVKLELDGKPVFHSDLIDTGQREEKLERNTIETVASFEVLFVGDRRILVRVEQGSSGDQVAGIIRELEPEHYSLHGTDDRLHYYLDCTKTRFRWWALGLASLGGLAILLGLDQIRRARTQPERLNLRRFT